ncbi:MAG: hypothetical protein Tsb0020_32570 [Haliangiales bacterium]
MSAAHDAELHPNEDIKMGPLSMRVQWIAWPLGFALLGLTVFLGSANGDHFHRFFSSYLVALTTVLAIPLGGMFFVILQPLTRSRWSPVVRRVVEIINTALFPLFLLTLGGIVIPMLMGSSGPYHHWVDAPATDHLVHGKHAWLNVPFFSGRIVIYFLVWIGITTYFRRKSVQQDESGDHAISEHLRVVSAPCMIIYALTVCFAAFDLLMSVDPHWFSTIFGVYYFAGCAMSIFAALALVLMFLQRSGKLVHSVTTEHYHDIGKLMFAFVFFWSYIAFSQFMLIWYANIPEETVWYQPRMFTSWADLSYVLLFGHFVVPFFFLLSRWTKRFRAPLALFAGWLLIMQFADMFWLVMPELTPEGASFAFMDVTAVLGVLFVCIAWVAASARKYNLIPVKDPLLGVSLGFENY